MIVWRIDRLGRSLIDVLNTVELLRGRFGRPPVNPDVITEKLAIVADARSRGQTAAEAAALVGWSRATLYRHQIATGTRTSTL